MSINVNKILEVIAMSDELHKVQSVLAALIDGAGLGLTPNHLREGYLDGNLLNYVSARTKLSQEDVLRVVLGAFNTSGL